MDWRYSLLSVIIIVLALQAANPAWSQTGLMVELDSSRYSRGDTITVSGQLTATTIDQPLLIQVKDPQGNIDRFDQFNAASNGSYTYSFTSGGLMNSGGSLHRNCELQGHRSTDDV